MERLSFSLRPGGRRVLVVDDDGSARREMTAWLRGAGYEVIEAAGALEALRLLLGHRPDAVVLDMVLPDGHGIEVGRAMRAIVTTQRTCVVAVTSDAASIAFVEPRTFGAEVVLLKPVAPAVLLEAVGRCFPTDEVALPVPVEAPSPPAP